MSAAPARTQSQKPIASVWHTVRQTRSAAIGGILVAAFVVLGLIGILLLAVPPLHSLWFEQDLSQALANPLGPGHLLGTDAVGRDLMARVVTGIGVSFTVGLAVTAISLAVGLTLGLLAGYYQGVADVVISAVIDVTWGFPVILLAVMLAGMVQPGFTSVVLAVALVTWAGFARIIRGYALSLREREFVAAAQALGVPGWRIIVTHLIPNVLAPTLVMASYIIAVTIIVESGLSFLGLGIQPPTPSLGQMLAEGRNYLRIAPWQALLPGITVAMAVLGFNLLGDGLRDILDPRLSRPEG